MIMKGIHPHPHLYLNMIFFNKLKGSASMAGWILQFM
jgi:hypothetical protein